VRRLSDAVAPGSYLVLSHVTSDNQPDCVASATLHIQRSDTCAKPRRRAEVEQFLGGFELVEPGLVPVEYWRPDSPGKVNDSKALLGMHVAVGRKR
jgi:hypothetical protein